MIGGKREPSAEEKKATKVFNQLTEAASTLMDAGELNIYSTSREVRFLMCFFFHTGFVLQRPVMLQHMVAVRDFQLCFPVECTGAPSGPALEMWLVAVSTWDSSIRGGMRSDGGNAVQVLQSRADEHPAESDDFDIFGEGPTSKPAGTTNFLVFQVPYCSVQRHLFPLQMPLQLHCCYDEPWLHVPSTLMRCFAICSCRG